MKNSTPFIILTIPFLIPFALTSCTHNSKQQSINSSNNASSQASLDVDMSINKQMSNANLTKDNNHSNKDIEQTDNNTKSAHHGLTEDFDTLIVEHNNINKEDSNTSNQKNSQTNWQWNLPKYFPNPKVPEDNPMTVAKVELGRFLFYDKRLSATGKTSCASCHFQHLAFTDGKARSVGATGELHPRSSIGLANVAYMPTLNWANPAVTRLEDQFLTPMFGDMPVEMGLTDKSFDKVKATFAKDNRYQQMFREAFGEQVKKGKSYREAEDYSLVEISQAIASFERSLISADSKFDRYMQGIAKMTDSEKRGKTLFFGEKAECHHCHGSFNFNDQVIHSKSRTVPIRFHNTGMYNLDEQGSYQENNEGLYEVTADIEDKGKFKAPSLRNVAITAPYNHDGSTKTLEEVVANYAKGGRIITSADINTNGNDVIQSSHNSSLPNLQKNDNIVDNEIAHETATVNKLNRKLSSDNNSHRGDGRFNPNKSDLIVRIELTKQEQADIVAFLRTLTDETLLTNPKYSNPWTFKHSGENNEANTHK